MIERDAPFPAVLERLRLIPLARPITARDPVWHYLESQAPSARAALTRALARCLEAIRPGAAGDVRGFAWHRLTIAHTSAVRAALLAREPPYSPATVNQSLVAMRRVLHWAWRLSLMPSSRYQRAVSIENIKYRQPLAGRAISSGELRTLVEQCDASTPMGARDAALLSLLTGCGLRRAEAVGLDLVDYADSVLRVLGKGNATRRVPLPPGARTNLDNWLAHRGDAPGPLLYRGRKGGRVVPARLSPGAALRIVERLALASGAGFTHTTPHDLRRTHVTELLERGVDPLTVAKMVGQEDLTTTLRYDRRGDRAADSAAGNLFIPVATRKASPPDAKART